MRGNAARNLLEGIRKSTREMIDEQEAVRGRLFTIQDVIQSTVRAWLQVLHYHDAQKLLFPNTLFPHDNDCLHTWFNW